MQAPNMSASTGAPLTACGSKNLHSHVHRPSELLADAATGVSGGADWKQPRSKKQTKVNAAPAAPAAPCEGPGVGATCIRASRPRPRAEYP